MSNRIIVVGGGAAGMLAAIVAKRQGSIVTLLERNMQYQLIVFENLIQ